MAAQYRAPDIPPTEERPEPQRIVPAQRLTDQRILWATDTEVGQRQLTQGV